MAINNFLKKDIKMDKRSDIVTMGGNPITLIGTEVKTGETAPDFEVVDNDLSPVAFSSFKLNFLDAGGSCATFLLASFVFGIGRWTFSVPILTFFILSSVLSKIGKKRKEKFVSVFEKSSRRDL